MRLTNPLLIIITTFIISCQSQDDGIKPNQSDASSTSQAGTIHNLYLSEIIDHFNQKTNKPTRSGDIAEDFIKQMASIQTVILKNQNFKNMTPAQINTFVRNSVDISIDPAIINGIESSLTTKGYSIIPEMNRDAPLTPAVKGFIEEIERIEAGNYSDVIIESKMAKAYTTWIREADNDEDKKLIADSYDVYLGSTKYWQNNSNAWEIGLKSSFKIGSFLKRIVFGDVKATAWACWKAKKYAIVFWKAMLAAGAATWSLQWTTYFLFTIALLLGIGFGTMFPAYNTLFVNLAPNNQRGTATSTYLTSWDVGIGAGMLLGGYIAEIATFKMAYLFGAALTVISLFYFRSKVAPHFHRHKLR